MYTELILGCDLSNTLPKICVDAIDTVVNYKKQPKYDNPQTLVALKSLQEFVIKFFRIM